MNTQRLLLLNLLLLGYIALVAQPCPTTYALNVEETNDDTYALYDNSTTSSQEIQHKSGASPIEFLDFSATVERNDVILHWTTAQEANNAGFEVQMRVEGTTYETVGLVSGNGTTTKPTSYAYGLEGLASGRYVFRLKQEDFNGGYTFSGQIEANIYNEADYTLYYRNPIIGGTTEIALQVKESQPMMVGLYSLDGQLVQSLYDEALEAHTPIAIPLNTKGLAEGMYILKVQGSLIQQLSHKVLIMK